MEEENCSLGYIKLFRSLLDWEWFDDSKTLHVFVYCLLRAGYKDATWKGINLKPGEFIGSRAQIAEKTRLTDSEVKTALMHLEKTGEIARKKAGKFTIYKVKNYSYYQQSADISTEKRRQNADISTEKPPKDKKERSKEVKNTTPMVPFDPFSIVSQSYSNPQVLEAWKGFIDMRSKLKGGKIASEHQLKLLMNALEKNARTDAERIDVINQSIMNGWKGLFPLKEKKNAANCTGYQNGDVSGAYDGYIPWDDYRGNV